MSVCPSPYFDGDGTRGGGGRVVRPSVPYFAWTEGPRSTRTVQGGGGGPGRPSVRPLTLLGLRDPGGHRFDLLCLNCPMTIGQLKQSKIDHTSRGRRQASSRPRSSPRPLPACWPVGARGVIACVASRAWHRLCGLFFGCVYFLLCRASAWPGESVHLVGFDSMEPVGLARPARQASSPRGNLHFPCTA